MVTARLVGGGLARLTLSAVMRAPGAVTVALLFGGLLWLSMSLWASVPAWAGSVPVPVVVIDPGHGGAQEGAAGPTGLKEKDLALRLATRVRERLKQRGGLRVVLTRDGDELVHLSDRVEATNRLRPDVFVSVHANSMPTQRLRDRVEGIETFFLSASASGDEAQRTAARENADAKGAGRSAQGDTLAYILADLQRSEAHADSSRLAYAVHERVVSLTRGEDRGVQQAPFFVLTGVDAPAVLVEVGYISHAEEGRRLATEAYQDQIAAGIAEGIVRFLSSSRARDGHVRNFPKE